MQRGTKSELQMLREFAWLHMPNRLCMFCKRPLIYRPLGMTFGHRRHPPIDVKYTVHHEDHNRENNLDGNLKDSHQRCHQQYHANLRRTNDPPDTPDC